MRILLDYRPALREPTGVGEYVHQLAKALAARWVDRSLERGAGDRRANVNADDVEVFTSSWRDRPSAAALADLGSVQAVDRRVPVRLLNLAWHRFGWPPVEWLTGHAYDVVHSPHSLLLPSRRAARVMTIPDLDFLLHPERTRAEIRRDYRALVHRHAAAADGVIVMSAYVGEMVERLLHVPADRVSVCPLGAPVWPGGGPTVRDAAAGRYVLFLGTLEPRKNVDGLLEAYAALLARRPDTPPLWLAGGAVAGFQAWREAIARPPLAGHVEYRGYVPGSERRALYSGARVLVLPSFDEGFGLPVIEAMSLGVPVVASNRGALPEVAGDAALLVDPEDTGALSRAIEEALFDESLAARLSRDGLIRALSFTWARTAELTRKAYERAIETRRQRDGS